MKTLTRNKTVLAISQVHINNRNTGPFPNNDPTVFLIITLSLCFCSECVGLASRPASDVHAGECGAHIAFQTLYASRGALHSLLLCYTLLFDHGFTTHTHTRTHTRAAAPFPPIHYHKLTCIVLAAVTL